MRSKWKGVFTDKLRIVSGKQPIIYSRRSMIFSSYVGKRFLIHNGLKLVSLLIRDWHVGQRFGAFVTTKRTGAVIHQKAKSQGAKKKGGKK